MSSGKFFIIRFTIKGQAPFAANKISELNIIELVSNKSAERRLFHCVRGRDDRFRTISTSAGTMKVAHANPRIDPVSNRDTWVLSQIPKTVSDQSIAIGIRDRNSQKRGIGSISSIDRQSG